MTPHGLRHALASPREHASAGNEPMAKAKKKPPRVKATKTKATKTKGTKAKPTKPTKAKPKAKPATPRKAARQQDIPATREHEPDAELDAAAHDTYEKTLTWQAAQRDQTAARKKLMEMLKKKLEGKDVDFYTTPAGLRVTLVRSKEKISLKQLDNTNEIELDPDE